YWYAGDIHLAQRYWERGQIDRAREVLERQRPRPGQDDLRGFEWYHLWRGCHAEHLTLPKQEGPVHRPAYAPAGTVLVTASGVGPNAGETAGAVRVWDAATGRLLTTLTRDLEFVPTLAFSRDGRLFVAAGDGPASAQRRHLGLLWEVAGWRL